METKKYKNVNVSLSLPVELREQAREAAYADNRSLSSYIAMLIREDLGVSMRPDWRGYMPPSQS